MRVSRFSWSPAAALALGLLSLRPAPALAQAFDGRWTIIESCPNFRDALGYTISAPATVRGGVLHADHGIAGQPSSFHIDGTIGPDGNARFLLVGLVGGADFVPGRAVPAGTGYAFHIDARFAGDRGTGNRVEGRPCDFDFSRLP